MSRFDSRIFFILQANFRLASRLSKSLYVKHFSARTVLCGLLLSALVHPAFAAITPQGSFVPVPLPSAELNTDIRTWTNGTTYNSVMSGLKNFNGVPFDMQTNGSGNNVIWATSTSVYSLGQSTYTKTVNISTSTYGTRSVFTLINTAYGSSGKNVGSLTFVADDGTQYVVNLVTGTNVRDHYSGTSLAANYVTNNVVGNNSGSHLDMQRFDLPASFAQKTLTSIIFRTSGNTQTGIPFLAGVTLDAQVELIAKYTMEEPVVWNGTSGELKDSANYASGPFNGRSIGNPIPAQAFVSPARSGATNGTCQYAELKGPSSNGGAFQLSNLPVNSAKSAQNSVSFWMYWKGNDATYPLGWNEYKLAFKNGLFGFDSGDGRMYARSSNGLANGWHHVAAVFTNLDLTSNKLYIDGVLQTLTVSGTQNLISSIDTNELTSTVTTTTWEFIAPPTGWSTNNPTGLLEVGRPSFYGVSGATTNYVIEIEADPNDYNLFTEFTPDAGEELTLSVDYAGRSGYLTGTDSAIDVFLNGVSIARMNTGSTTFTKFTMPLGIATGQKMKIELRSVDRNRYGGLVTNIQIFRNRGVATSSLVIGGFGKATTNRFIGNIDEVKVYRGGITQAQVNADYAETHQCLSLHHARLDHSGSGVTCAPTQVYVRGCSNPDLNGVCTPSVIAFSGTVVAQSNGVTVATAPFAIPAGQNATMVELSVPNPQATTLTVVNYNIPPYGNPQTTCWDGSSNSSSCQFVFNDAGFIVSDTVNGSGVNVPNQVAGVSSGTYYLRAVKKNTSTSACEAALQGSQNINFGYVCNNPTVCSASNLMTVTGSATVTVARNNNAAGFFSTTAVPMIFDANGNAPFSFNFYDAGQATLFMKKTTSSNAALSGNTNAFVTKPFSLSVSGITTSGNVANPAAANAAGARFVKAGEAFKATINARAANGNATPNFGKEVVPEVVRLNATLIAPAGGSAGVMTGNDTAIAGFTNGSSSLTNIKWSEVGIIQLTPAILDNDYLGAGSVTGLVSANVGRFYPDHFKITAGTETKACSSQFTYFGQDGLNTSFTLTAENMSNGTTQNYTGTYGGNSSFMKFNTTLRDQYSFTSSPSFPLDASATAITGTWLNGVGSINAKHIVRKPASRTAPTNITFNAHPVDDDGVTITAASAPVSGATPFRYGRLFLQSNHGSELNPLPMRVEAQFWDGNGYARNTLDSCSDVPLSGISMKNYHGNLNACETQLSGVADLVNGTQTVRLSAPGLTAGVPNTGSVDLEVNLNAAAPGEKVCLTNSESNATSAAMPWLLDNGAEPVGKATFGRNRVPMIYMRENF